MRRSIAARILFVSAICLLTTAGRADVVIRSSPGGNVEEYLALFGLFRDAQQRIIIDGPCLSACTLVLGVLPRDHICVTKRAVLGFHAPKAVDRYGHQFAVPQATTLLTAAYPAPVRAWIGRHGGLTGKFIWLRGSELRTLYRSCG